MTGPEILPENRAALAEHPGVLDAVGRASAPRGWEVIRGENGLALRAGGVLLHHPTHPVRDAHRWAADALARIQTAGADRAVVIGFGLGHHVEALRGAFAGSILVIEPDAGALLLALAERDLSELLRQIDLRVGDAWSDADVGRGCVLAYAPALLVPGGRHAEFAQRCERAAARSVGGLRILVVTPLYGGSHPIAHYSCSALRRLGHQAQILDLSDFLPGFERLSAIATRSSRRKKTESLYCDALGDAVAAKVEEEEFDVVLALAQAPLGPPALEAIRKAGAVSALWFVEDRRVFPYWRAVGPFYDHVFTIQTGECLSEMRAAGVGRASYLPCAAAPEVHRPLALTAGERAAFGSPVSFVGAGYRNRRHALRRFLDLDFRLWGSDWEGAAGFDRFLERSGARVSTEDTVRIFNATAVNLNLHSSTYCDEIDPRGDFVNPRTFEIASCGAFQIVDRRRLLPELFDVGGEIVAVDSVAEMKEAAVHYLRRPDERAAIAAAGRERVLRDHTYEKRMEDLVLALVSERPERFSGRSRRFTVGDARELGSAALRDHLEGFEADVPFTLNEMVRRIPEAEGPLTEGEALFLFLSQFDDLYLGEYRQ